MTVYAINEMATVPGYGYAYDGQNFYFAYYNENFAATGTYSDDGFRQEYEFVGWQTNSRCPANAVPAYIREFLLERFAEAQTEPEPAEPVSNSSNPVTIGGITEPRWVWADGVEIYQHPTESELSTIQDNGWEVSESPVWRVTLNAGQDPDRTVTINGRTLPASCHCGVKTGYPTAAQEEIYHKEGFSIEQSTSWFICEPRENGGYYE